MRVLLGVVGLGLAWLVWADRGREAFALLMVALALLFGLVWLQGVAGLPSVLRQVGTRRVVAGLLTVVAWVPIWLLQGGDSTLGGALLTFILLAVAFHVWPWPRMSATTNVAPPADVPNQPILWGILLGVVATGIVMAVVSHDIRSLFCAPLGAPFGAMFMIWLMHDREEAEAEPEKEAPMSAPDGLFDRELDHWVVRG